MLPAVNYSYSDKDEAVMKISGRFFKRLFFLSFFSLGILHPPVSAQEVVIMTGEWKPFVSSELENYGFTAEIVRQACLAAGIKPTFQFAPWPRCEASVKHGKAFAAFPYTFTEERIKFSFFSRPLSKARTTFFYNTNHLKTFTFSGLKKLTPYLIGGVRGYYYIPMFKKFGLSIDYSDNEDDALKKLFHGRVDIVPLNEQVGWEIAGRLYPNQGDIFSTSKTHLDETDIALMVSARYPDAAVLLKNFNEGLKTIQSNGLYKEIFQAYGIPLSMGCLKK